jgi:HEAT repeat protein
MGRIPYAVAFLSLLWLSSLRIAAQTPDHTGQVPEAIPLGALIRQSEAVVVLEVARVDKEKQLVVFKKAAVLKGECAEEEFRDSLKGSSEARSILGWAKPGQKAITFFLGGKRVTCLGNHWYYNWDFGESDENVWSTADWVDRFRTTYVGSVEKLRQHVAAILAGREVTITATWAYDPLIDRTDDSSVPFRLDWLRGKKGRVCRIKASLKIDDCWDFMDGSRRHFVGWGVGGPEAVPGLIRALAHEDIRVRAEAAEDLGQLGSHATPALPALRMALSDPDGYARINAAESLARLDATDEKAFSMLIEGCKQKEQALRAAAVEALATLDPPRREAIPALIDALGSDRDDKVRAVAACGLGRVGEWTLTQPLPVEDAVTALGQALKQDKDERVRLWSAKALLKFGRDAGPALPALRSTLRKKSVSVARMAAEVMVRLGKPAIPFLVDALNDQKCRVRDTIAAGLADLGPSARPAIPALLGALTDDDQILRWEAASALLHIDRKLGSENAVTIIRELLIHGGGRPKLKAMNALAYGEPIPEFKSLAPALAEVLRTDQPPFRRLAALSLAKIGPNARDAQAALEPGLRDEDGNVRVNAALALARIGRSRDAVTALVQELEDKDEHVRFQATETLGEIGPQAQLAVPVLRQALKNAPLRDRSELALALWRIERREEAFGVIFDPRQDALAVLIDLLGVDQDPEVRESAILALRHIGPEAGPAVPSLVRALKTPNLAIETAVTLGAIGPEACSAQPALGAALRDEDYLVRLHAALALCRIQDHHEAAHARIVEELERQPTFVSLVEGELLPLGPAARPLAPCLLRCLRHERHDVYLSAARLLKSTDPQAAAKAGVP